MEKEKIGIYVHIPFCLSKCKYCDFLSFQMDEINREKYIQALIKEIKGFPDAKKYTVASVFIGGGTPTVSEKSQLTRILDSIFDKFDVLRNAEVTIECNPKTADLNKMKAIRYAGVNRLSIGVQSMEDRFLQALGRVHRVEDVYDTFTIAKQAGFTNINADLMFSLPGQTVDDWEKTLKMALELKPAHISAYSLIIEENTPFYDKYHDALCERNEGNEQSLLPSEEDEIKMYELTQKLLAENGFKQYEVSNFALEGYESVHNDGYWTRRSYIGFGLGAASLVNETRYENTRDFKAYLENSSDIWHKNFNSDMGDKLDIKDSMSETMFLGLRRKHGVSKTDFRLKFGVDVMEVYGSVINKQKQAGLLIVDEDEIYLSDKGNLVSNICLAEYLPD